MNRVFRVFVSSTFGDFQAEREALRSKVWPSLERYCQGHGTTFQAIDLRWGIPPHAAETHEILAICLNEIARCQRLSPRPNFIMLLGDRYGWRPAPAEIPREEFEAIQALLRKEDDADGSALLDAWYGLDENAVPPYFCLLPSEGMAESEWNTIEQRLLTVLRNSAEKLGMTPERHERYFLSATHQEIIHGVLRPEGVENHVFAFRRNIRRWPEKTELKLASAFIDLDAEGRLDSESAVLRAELWAEICARLPEAQRFDYGCDWQGDGISLDHLDSLCADVEASLKRVIDEELARLEGEVTDPLEQELAGHAAFAAQRARLFVGREAELQTIAEHLTAALTQAGTEALSAPLIVQGQGGSGKSALLAKAIKDAETAWSQAEIVCRFIGTTPRSGGLFALLADLLTDLARRYGVDETLPEGGLKELINEFPKRLALANPERPLILFLDALDQLGTADLAHYLHWLPNSLPPHVALVLSVLDGPVADTAVRRFPKAGVLSMPLLGIDDGARLLDAWLGQGDRSHPPRRISSAQKQAILRPFEHDGLPLYLRIATDLAQNWRSWEAPPILPDILEELIRNRIALLQRRHGEVLAERALAYLAAARHGLSDTELSEVLWRDTDVHAEFEVRRHPDQPDVDTLPQVVWSRLSAELAPYLTQIFHDRVLLHRFFHPVLGQVVSETFLPDEAARSRHRVLAEYFQEQPLYREAELPNARKLMEEPRHWLAAGDATATELVITDFDFAMAKCRLNRSDDWAEDLRLLLTRLQASKITPSNNLAMWENFVQNCAHLLRCGDADWPAHKILLQLAIEHADDSPVTQKAEVFLDNGQCDWYWSRKAQRPGHQQMKTCLVVLDGHIDEVVGAIHLPNGLLVSWSWDHTMRLWDGVSGVMLAVLEDDKHRSESELAPGADHRQKRLWEGGLGGRPLLIDHIHNDHVFCAGALALLDNRLLYWSESETLRLLDGKSGALKTVLTGHTNWVRGALALSDGRILSWSLDGTLRLWDGASGASMAVLTGHTDWVWGALALSDGRLLSWSLDHTLRLWDSSSGAPLAVLTGHTDRVRGAVALSSGNLLSWSQNGTLRLWDSATGAPLALLKGHTDAVCGALELSDGRLLSWSYDKTLRIWDGISGTSMMEIKGHAFAIRGASVLSDGRLLSWSADTRYLLAFDEYARDHTLRLWDGSNGASLGALEGHTGGIDGGLMLSDGRLVSWSWDHTLRLWDLESGETLAVLVGHTNWVKGALELPDGRLLSWSDDHTLRIWNIKESMPKVELLPPHRDVVWGVKKLSNGHLLSWSDDNTLRLWDRISGDPLAVLAGHTRWVDGALELFDGRIVSWSHDRTLRLWDGDNGTPLAVLEGHIGPIEGVLPLPDGRLLSWSTNEQALHLWDGANGTLLAVLEGHSDWVRGALVLPDGRLITWSLDHTLRLWDRASEAQSEMQLTLFGHTAEVIGALELADGRLLSWSNENTLRLWDGVSGAPLAILEGHTEVVRGAVELDDGRILSWSWDRTLRLWDGANGEALVLLTGHTDYVNGALVLYDGSLLSWSEDQTLRLWDGLSGVLLGVMEGHTQSVDGALELSDGRLLSWSCDTTLLLWNRTSESPLAMLKGHTDFVYGALELSDGRLISWSGDNTLCLWNGASGTPLAVLEGHTDWVYGALELSDGNLLSWSNDHTLRIWDKLSGMQLGVMEGHTQSVDGALELSDGRLLSWSRGDNTLRLWNVVYDEEIMGKDKCIIIDFSDVRDEAVLEGHTQGVLGALELTDGRLLSWSFDGTLRLWDGASGALLAILTGHTDWVEGAQVLSDGRLLSWSGDNTLRIWNGAIGAPRTVLVGHKAGVWGALVLADARLLSWSEDYTLCLWKGINGGPPLAILKGHTDWVRGALELSDGRLLTWSEDHTLRLWDGLSGAQMSVLAGHTAEVWGALALSDGRLLSWSDDHTLRLWEGANGAPLEILEGHTCGVWGALVLPDGRLLSWSRDQTFRLWDVKTGEAIAVFPLFHKGRVSGTPLDRSVYFNLWGADPSSFISWSENNHSWNPYLLTASGTPFDRRRVRITMQHTVRLWDGTTGEVLLVDPLIHKELISDAPPERPDHLLILTDCSVYELLLFEGSSRIPFS